jgi:hypothetical protein
VLLGGLDEGTRGGEGGGNTTSCIANWPLPENDQPNAIIPISCFVTVPVCSAQRQLAACGVSCAVVNAGTQQQYQQWPWQQYMQASASSTCTLGQQQQYTQMPGSSTCRDQSAVHVRAPRAAVHLDAQESSATAGCRGCSCWPGQCGTRAGRSCAIAIGALMG